MKPNDYMKVLLKTVQSRDVKAGIQSELQDCIEDLTEMYIEEGMTREEAEAEAIRQMGDPKETGEMFNHVYKSKFEWRSSWYMLLWILLTVGLRLLMAWAETLYNGTSIIEEYQKIKVVTTLAGIILLLPAMWLSYAEKADDLPFLWLKKMPTKHWQMKGLGVFGNAAAVSGVGIGLMANTLAQGFCLYGLITILMLLQRLFIVEELIENEQKYIFQECVALKDFHFRGPVFIGNEKHKVQLERGESVKKGDYLIITRTDGFWLIAEKM